MIQKLVSWMPSLSPVAIISVVGGSLAAMFGGWDAALITLVVCMTADYLSGLVLAGVFKKSPKSENGALESRAGFKGLCRKGVMLLLVLVTVRLDALIGSDFIRNTAIIALVINELLSLLENIGLMGITYPPILDKAIDILRSRVSEQVENLPDKIQGGDKNG